MPPASTAEEAAPALVLPPPAKKKISYGWKLAIADGVAIAGILVSGLTMANCNDEALCGWQEGTILLSLASLALTSPMLHLTHRNPGRAGLSLSLRIGVPLAGFLVGSATCSGIGDCAMPEGMAIAGLGAVLLTDWLVMAWKKPTERKRDLVVAPMVTREGTGLTLAGSF